jgi:hypothetical protein
MKIASSSSSIEEIIERETTTCAQLIKIFLFKVIECICSNRCPADFSDLEDDTETWFSISIPKSQSLRQLSMRSREYGWIQIDVTLTNPETLLERWINYSQSRPIFGPDPAALKRHLERCFAQTLRSVHCVLNALPAQSLSYQFGQLSVSNRRITAVSSHFQSLPVKNSEWTENSIVQEFGRSMTPLGSCWIKCFSVRDFAVFLPCIFRWAKPESVSVMSKSTSNTGSAVEFPVGSFSDDFLERSLAEGPEEEEKPELELPAPASALELAQILEGKTLVFRPEDREVVRARFDKLAKEVEDLQTEWAEMSG